MKTSAKGRQLIESFEGLILGAYDDATDHIVKSGEVARGTLTIGYGHTNAAGPPTVHSGQTITKIQADDILARDLVAVEKDVTRLVKVPLNQNQFDALVSFQFNTGSLGRSSILTALNNKDYKLASDKFMLYTKGRVNGGLVPMAGLVRRRKAEQVLFNSTNAAGASTGTAGAVVVAGGTSAALYWSDHWVGILGASGGILVAVVLVYLYYSYRKSLK